MDNNIFKRLRLEQPEYLHNLKQAILSYSENARRFDTKTILEKAEYAKLEEKQISKMREYLEFFIKKPDLQLLAWIYYYTLFESGKEYSHEISELPMPELSEKKYPGMLAAVIFLASSEHLNSWIENNNAYNSFYDDYFSNYRRFINVNYRDRGNLGICGAYIYWLYAYSKPKIFRIKRLSFEMSRFRSYYDVYLFEQTGEHIPIARSGYRYGIDGRQTDSLEGFEPVSEIINHRLKGYTYDKNGLLIFQPVFIDLNLYKLVISLNDYVISIHIPGDGKLSEDDVLDSIQSARLFFKEKFPDFHYKAFVCSSWLLDTDLSQFLSPESNILMFQQCFRIILSDINNYSLYSHIFNVKLCPPEHLIPKNRFQSAILDYIKNGGILYSGYGYFF